ARENFATGLPWGVYLISGSLPRFPTRMTLFTLFPLMTAGSFEMLTIAELGDPESVSPVLKICDESGGLGESRFTPTPCRDRASRVSGCVRMRRGKPRLYTKI